MLRTVKPGATAAALAMVAVAMTAGVALAATFIGNDAPNTIVGTADSDVIEGRGGGDELHGQGSVDAVYGGEGDDLIRGGLGADHPGFDIGPLVPGLYGGFGDDRVEGNGGGDLIVGGAGADLLIGGGATTRSGTPGRARWTTSAAATGWTSWRQARAIRWPPTARGWSAPSATRNGRTEGPGPLLPSPSYLTEFSEVRGPRRL